MSLSFLKYSGEHQYEGFCFDPVTIALFGTAAAQGALASGAALATTAGLGATAGLIGAGGAVTLGGLATAGMALATGLGGLASFRSSQAEEQAAKANARIAEQNAETTRQQNDVALERQDRESRLRKGSAIAAAGASGTGISSFGDILQSSAAQEELDLLTLKSEGILRENDFVNDASLSKSKAKSAKQQGQLGAASSILGMGGSFA